MSAASGKKKKRKENNENIHFLNTHHHLEKYWPQSLREIQQYHEHTLVVIMWLCEQIFVSTRCLKEVHTPLIGPPEICVTCDPTGSKVLVCCGKTVRGKAYAQSMNQLNNTAACNQVRLEMDENMFHGMPSIWIFNIFRPVRCKRQLSVFSQYLF